MLTNTVWERNALVGQFEDVWLVELDNSSAGTLRIATASVQCGGNYYEGAILNKPRLRSSIDLVKSKGGTSNLTLNVANFKKGTSLLSELIYGASPYYINHEVRVYSQINGQQTLANCLQLFTGRLVSVRMNGHDQIALTIEESRPWDFLKIPNLKTAYSGRYFPVVYGSFTPNASTQGSRAICGNLDLFPVEVEQATQATLIGLVHDSISTQGRLHTWEDGARQFVPITDSSAAYTDSSETYPSIDSPTTDGNIIKADATLYQAFIMKPTEYSGTGSQDFTDPENSYDFPRSEDSTTEASLSLTATNVLGDNGYLRVGLPLLNNPGSQTSTTVKVKVRWTATTTAGSGTPTANTLVVDSSDSSVAGTIASMNIDGGETTGTITGTMDASGDLPTEISIRANLGFLSVGTSLTVLVEIHDVTYECATEVEASGDSQSRQQAKKVNWLYCGAEGLSLGDTYGSGTAQDVHEVHRDILYRYAGIDATPDGWSALDTARSGWSVRAWWHKPTSVKDILEQLQYEGCFMYVFAADGDPKYVYVKSSYSSGDVDATLIQDDIDGLSLDVTDLGDLVTKKQINYTRHPATDDLIDRYDFENATTRSNYNIQAEENIEEVDLEYLVASVDDHATYYDNINGAPKMLGSCKLLNAKYWTLETGDIIQFDSSNMPVPSFATAWTAYFMVTQVNRTPGEVSISFREVG